MKAKVINHFKLLKPLNLQELKKYILRLKLVIILKKIKSMIKIILKNIIIINIIIQIITQLIKITKINNKKKNMIRLVILIIMNPDTVTQEIIMNIK